MIGIGASATLLIIAVLWIAISRLLAHSLRQDDPEITSPDRLSAKTAPWRNYPANKTSTSFLAHMSRSNTDVDE